MQFVIPALHTRRCGVGDALSCILPTHVVAPPPHLPDEVLPVSHFLHYVLYGSDKLEFPAFSPDGGPVLPCLDSFFSLCLPVGLQRGQAVFPADLVADQSHFFQCLGRKVELFSGIRLDGVDDEVGMKMLRVQVGRDQNFTVWEEPLRQFQRDSMGLCRSDPLLRREGLDVLIEESVVRFAVQILGGHETLVGEIRHTVNACEVAGSILIQGLLFLCHIPHDAMHRARRLFGFLDEATRCHRRSPDPSP